MSEFWSQVSSLATNTGLGITGPGLGLDVDGAHCKRLGFPRPVSFNFECNVVLLFTLRTPVLTLSVFLDDILCLHIQKYLLLLPCLSSHVAAYLPLGFSYCTQVEFQEIEGNTQDFVLDGAFTASFWRLYRVM